MSVSATNSPSPLVAHLMTRKGMIQDARNGAVLVSLFLKAQQDLAAVTPTRGNLINTNV